MPRTVAELNLPPATIIEAPSVDTSKARMCSIKSSTYLTRNCLVTSAVRHTHIPTTVYPICGDLIVVLDRNISSSISEQAADVNCAVEEAVRYFLSCQLPSTQC